MATQKVRWSTERLNFHSSFEFLPLGQNLDMNLFSLCPCYHWIDLLNLSLVPVVEIKDFTPCNILV